MTRREIIAEAKWLVIQAGPARVLEFGAGIVSDYPFGEKYDNCMNILDEAVDQATRVHHFLGFDH